MILQGDLKDFSLADLLQLLMQQRKTGTLLLTSSSETAELAISQGNILGVKVGGQTPETRIRQILVEDGRIGAREMADLEAVSVNMNRPLLATLIAKGLLVEEERESLLAIASEDMVCDLFTWTSGNYEFGTTQKGMSTGAAQIRISTEFACMEGMRRIDEWPRLREKIADSQTVFLKGDLPCVSEDPWEQRVFELIDGETPMPALVKRLPFGSFRLHECVVNLWESGCILPREGGVPQAETVPMADPRAERDQKTGLVLGISSLIITGALVFRLAAAWLLHQAGSDGMNTPRTRAESSILRNNDAILVVEHLSRTGNPAQR